MSHHGSCLCGAVGYTLAAEITGATLCHCSMCRKASGSAYAANATVAAAAFELTRGADVLREFQSSQGKYRAFCTNCGAPIYARYTDAPDALRLRLGSLDSALEHRPVAHIFAGSHATWDASVEDGLPCYDARIPG